MQLAIKYMKEMNVLYTPCEHGAMKEQGLTSLGTRWVCTNKGDTEHPFIRARLVARETKRTTDMDLTDTSMTSAAIPLVERFRFLLSRAMTGEKKRNPQDELLITFFDISRAHFRSPVRRKVAIRMQGDPPCPSGIAMLNRAMFGTKDTAQCFDSYCERTMEKLDYNIGVFNPCLYKHPVKDVSVLRHGDDFATRTTRTQIADFKVELSKHLLVKHIATLCPRPQLLDACEERFLNLVIRWVVPPFGKAAERIEIEADPRHSELLIKISGLQINSKGVNTPGERPRDSLRTVKLSPQDSTSYRSNVMRLAYLSADRIELQFASKELARSMAEPTTADVQALKRCIRFLLKYPRCIQSFKRQEIVPKQITCYSDSNFAGCLQSRKSTSSCKIFYGKHLLKSTSTTQAVVSLSSAEAEFYAAVKAAAAGICCVSMMRDLGVVLQQQVVEVKAKGLDDGVDSPSLEIKLGATAGRANAMLRGAGRIRHIETPTLWLQRLAINSDIKMTRVGGNDNCVDLGTKHLDCQTMNRHLMFCGMRFAEGRSWIAPQLEHLSTIDSDEH